MNQESFTELVDLADERLGGRVVYANDDFFASKDNLLLPHAPVFDEHRYTDRGKWMDGWESRRRRTAGHDQCIIKLGLPGVVRGLIVDTSYFRGNFPEAFSMEGICVEGNTRNEELLAADAPWFPLHERAALAGDSRNLFVVRCDRRVTHVRFHIYPDGGVARLRVHGEVVPALRKFGPPGSEVDLASLELGARVIGCSDNFFGSRNNLILPGRPTHMGDGWETKRSRREGYDYIVLELGAPGHIHALSIDTTHFKGNYPDSCRVEACHRPGAAPEALLEDPSAFSEILPETSLMPHTQHWYERELIDVGLVSHVKLCIYPDGGVARLRVHGTIPDESRVQVALRRWNSLPEASLRSELMECCHSRTWATETAKGAPFSCQEALLDAADRAFAVCTERDLDEAIHAHPRLGDRSAASGPNRGSLSAREQAVLLSGEATDRERLDEYNRAYEAKHGFVFLLLASGKSTREVLAALETRLGNSTEEERVIARRELVAITKLRLAQRVRT